MGNAIAANPNVRVIAPEPIKVPQRGHSPGERLYLNWIKAFDPDNLKKIIAGRSMFSYNKLPQETQQKWDQMAHDLGVYESPSASQLEYISDVIDLATDQGLLKDGETEVDSNTRTSEGNDNGAYLLTWTWVSFAGTKFDNKEEEDDDE